MKLAILSRAPRCYSTQRLKLAAIDRGHTCKVLDTLRFAIDLSGPEPDLQYRGKPLSDYDAIDKLVEQGRQNASASTGASAPDAASAPAAVAPAAAAPASAASGTDVLRSREAFRSRSREDDLK